MKLELDINSAQNSLLDNYSDNSNNTKTEEVKKMLRSGINLAKEGNRAEARQMLLKVTEAEPENETAWLWLASISEYPEELLIFLQNVLKVNPENERALEWAKQTKTLLSKTFVQRGINASHENQKEFAKQCFLQGIVHDNENEMAWLWLASTSDSQEEKLSHLQKVLQINPENETALSSLSAVRSQMSQGLLKKANSAAISGDREGSKQMLETIMKFTPNLEEAWMLKAYLANEYYEKIEFYQKALEINPNSEAAQAGLASLQALAQKITKPAPEVPQPVVEESPVEVAEPVSEVTAEHEESPEVTEKVEEIEQPHQELTEEVVDQPVVEEVVEEAATEETAQEAATAELEQPVEQTESQEVVVEQTVAETVFTEVVEPESQQVVVEEPQAEFAEGVVVEESQPQVEEPVQSFETEPQEFQAIEQEFHAAETFAEVTEPEQTQMKVDESEDSPTQELDEEFARTTDAVFNSYQEPETFQQEAKVDSSEFLSEPQSFEDEAEEEKSDELVEQVQAEDIQPVVFEADPFASEVVLRNEPVVETTGPEQMPAVQVEEPYIYQTPYFGNNGFEMISASEPFADYQQPTVELTSSEFAEISAPVSEYVEQNHKEVSFPESFSTEVTQPFQPQVEHSTNGFGTEHHAETEVVEEFEAAQEVLFVEEPAKELQLSPCPFCEFENEAQNIVCHSCQAMLSLSDLEMMLAHQDANQDLLLASIEKMEVERTLRDFSVDELTNLGIAYLNARNLRKGFSYLKGASQLNPNDVVLSSKVNFLAIRLNEIEEHDHKVQEKPVQSRTILVVDDSPTVRKLISGKLEKSGHSVISAIDGMDALAKINEVIPDLILLDITMPRLDGYQVCKLIRNNEVTKEIPIVMISGKDGFFDKVRGRMAGSTGYITKPFGPDTLMKTIETYLG